MNPANYGVRKRFQAATLESLNPELFGDVLKYAENAKEFMAAGRGFLLSGPPGVGKTWAMAALMLHCKKKLDSRFDFYMVTAPELFDSVYVPHTYDGPRHYDDFRSQPLTTTYERVPALVINDLGKEDRSREWLADAAAYKLGRLLRGRHERQLPVFITTNLALQTTHGDTVEKVYGPSLWSLIYDLTSIRAQVTGPDLRKQQK